MKALKDNAKWVSKVFKQESNEPDWKRARVNLTCKPLKVKITEATTDYFTYKNDKLEVGQKILVREGSDIKPLIVNKIEETTENVEYYMAVGDSGKDDYLYGITTDSNGNIFVCGCINNGPNQDFYIAKLDNDLNLVKQVTIDSGYIDYLQGITTDSNGNIFVCGYTRNGSKEDFYVAKFDNNLNLVKQVIVDGGNSEEFLGITIDSNNNVFVCGHTNNSFYIGKFDNDLNLIKQITINNTNDWLYNITIDFNGNVFVCGYTYNGSDQDFYIGKFDNDLNLIKQITIDARVYAILVGIVTDSNGNVFVCGHTHNDHDRGLYVAKFDNDLNLIKQATIENMGGELLGLTIDSEGNIFACGSIDNGSNKDFYIAKFDSNLNLIRQIQINSGKHDIPRDIVIDSTGDIFVCGYIGDSSNYDFFVAKFNNNLDHPSSITVGSYSFLFTEPDLTTTDQIWLPTTQSWAPTTQSWSPTTQSWAPTEVSYTWDKGSYTVKENVYKVDISSLNLKNPPSDIYKENSIRVEFAFEDVYERCTWKDLDVTSQIIKTGNNYVVVKELDKDLVRSGDVIKVNDEDKEVSKVEVVKELGTFVVGNDSKQGQLYGIVTDSNNNVFVCGNLDNKAYIAKFDNHFNITKQIIIDKSYSRFLDIVVDSNDNVFVCGQVDADNDSRLEFYITKFDNSLNLVKHIVVDSGKGDEFHGITTDSNGNIFVCGFNEDFYIAKFDNDLNLIKQITINSGYVDHLYDITVDSNGNIFVCGDTYNGSVLNFYIAKFDNNLNLIKQITINSGNSDICHGIITDSYDNVFVCGHSYSNSSDYNFYVAKFDNDLNLIKQITIESSRNDNLYRITTDSNNNVFVCGRTYNGSNDDSYIAKFDNDLNLIKQITIDSTNDEIFQGVTTDSNGNIFVCGYVYDIHNSHRNFYIAKFNNDLDHPNSVTVGSYTFTFNEPSWAPTTQSWSPATQSWTPTTQSWSPQPVSFTPNEVDYYYDRRGIGEVKIITKEELTSITKVVIPKNTKPIESQTYTYNSDWVTMTYKDISKNARYLRLVINGDKDVYVDRFQVDLWTE